jgi:6-pyruvoyltetrahydropterin/6-carboxytetrahydropterin synthase
MPASVGERILYAAGATFESARRLPGGPPGSAARAMGLHGHSFRAAVRARAPGSVTASAAQGAPAVPAVPAVAAVSPGSALPPESFAGGEIDALRQRLQAAIAPLDYQLLNDHLDAPTDENLAHWIGARLHAAAPARISVHSTRSQGVDLDEQGRAHAWRRYEFESAHCLPRVPAGHKCGRMHGHGFAVLLHVPARDAARLDAAWAPLHARLHHACLNDIRGLENPTSECIAAWIWTQLRPELPGVSWVTVHETATCGAHFDGATYRIWKDIGFDSAVRLLQAPEGDSRRRVHGHSYRLRLHLAAPLDPALGWTIDFGDVKEIFAPVFDRLDHRPLHELPGVADGGTVAIARWAREQAAGALPQLERIDLYETPGCGVILAWGPAQALVAA